MVKMETKKYSRPFLSESLADMASMIGCAKKSSTTDALSRPEVSLEKSSDEDEGERESIFSKFT